MAEKRRTTVPKGYNALMPYLRVKDAATAIDFYKQAFGAKEKYRLMMGGRVGHAELKFGDCVVMLSDEFPDKGIVGPKTLGGTSFTLSLYVANVDKAVEKAASVGATVTQPPQDQFYGDRTARLEDPFGHSWSIQGRFEDVTPKQMQKRLDAMMGIAPPVKAKAPAKAKKKG